MPHDSYHMSPEGFRRHGHRLIDWIADYLEQVESFGVTPSLQPGQIRERLPRHPPEEPEAFDRILEDLDAIVMPGVVHWQSPRWFAYFPANASPPSILGELAAAALGQQGMLWSTSPVATELEAHLLDWLVDLLGLPEAWKTSGPGGGVIQTTASDSTHTALFVARYRARQRGAAEAMVTYVSTQTHSSIEKGARIAGYGHLRPIDVDDERAMRPDALQRAIETDARRGLIPVLVTSTVGTTGTTAVDPVRAVGQIARRYGLWHHVDAAYAGSAMICPELRHHQDGLELADSYVFNPHKWLFTAFDCSVFYVADRAALTGAMRIEPPYLRAGTSAATDAIDYRDWHVALGRRFRALKLWFVLRSYGATGLRHHIREHIRLARALAERIDADLRFARVAPVPFALVCFRCAAGNRATERLADRINATGQAYVTCSTIDGVSFLRVSIGQTFTEQRHVDRLWELIDRLAVSTE